MKQILIKRDLSFSKKVELSVDFELIKSIYYKYLPDYLIKYFLSIGLAVIPVQEMAHAHDIVSDTMIQSYRDTLSTTQPARDTLWLCRGDRTRTMSGFAYYDAATGLANISKKPVVSGRINWPSTFSLIDKGEYYDIFGNGLPKTPTGEFPNSYNPNSVEKIDYAYRIHLRTGPEQKYCLPMGPIGVAMNGAMIFNALTARHDDAQITEILDLCGGHPDPRGGYHHHGWSTCWDDIGETEPVGLAFDGFLIFGPKENGILVRNADLDECHGHSHIIKNRLLYHYHINYEFPYSLGCYQAASQIRP